MLDTMNNMMKINILSRDIVDAVFQVHKNLGPGLFESVYEEILALELDSRGLSYTRQQLIPIRYKDQVVIEHAFKADIIVEDAVVIELKSVEQLLPVHYKQLQTYLRLTDKRLGLLINFNEVLIKHGIYRVVNNL